MVAVEVASAKLTSSALVAVIEHVPAVMIETTPVEAFTEQTAVLFER
jgi:hypothetical protein